MIGALCCLIMYRPAYAHNGVDHNNSCFLSIGDTRLRINGYQFQPELEGKHFCHFFPELGQIVQAVEPMTASREKTWITLELAALSTPFTFTVLKQQPPQLLEGGLASISETIERRSIYRLTMTLQDASGHRQQQRFVFLVGFPVTKIMVMLAGLLVLVVGYAGVRDFNKKLK